METENPARKSGVHSEVISEALARKGQRYLKQESDTKGMAQTYSGGKVMTIQDREKRVRRILRKHGRRLMISKRRQAYYTIIHESEVENETDFLEFVEWVAVIRDRAATDRILLAERKLHKELVEAALKKLDK